MPEGQVLFVLGELASGKSAFINYLIGEMSVKGESFRLKGGASYAS